MYNWARLKGPVARVAPPVIATAITDPRITAPPPAPVPAYPAMAPHYVIPGSHLLDPVYATPSPPQPSGVPEAPTDGQTYARQNAAWVALDMSVSASIAELEEDVSALEAKFPQAAAMVKLASTASTTSTTYVMEGLGATLTAGPSGRCFITVDGQLTNNKSGGQTTVVLCYGTGTPPAVNSPQVGTIITQPSLFTSSLGTGTATAPFSLSAVVSGLTPNTTYWFDLALQVSSSSTGNVQNVDMSAHGIA